MTSPPNKAPYLCPVLCVIWLQYMYNRIFTTSQYQACASTVLSLGLGILQQSVEHIVMYDSLILSMALDGLFSPHGSPPVHCLVHQSSNCSGFCCLGDVVDAERSPNVHWPHGVYCLLGFFGKAAVSDIESRKSNELIKGELSMISFYLACLPSLAHQSLQVQLPPAPCAKMINGGTTTRSIS